MNKLTSKFYLVGIKGNGMSALAGILYDLGYEVVGSDNENYYYTEKNINKIKCLKFDVNNITKDYFYIISNAYDEKNIEVNEIIKFQYMYMYYSEFIEYFFNGIKIGISGTHGKTTTTSICSKFLEDEKICALIGDGTGIGNCDYKYVIFEACEYKNNFHKYTYDYLIINNIDYDHVDFFEKIDDVVDSFQKASEKAKCVIVNNDDENGRKIKHNNKITFGKSYDSDYVITNIKTYSNGFTLDIVSNNSFDTLKIPLLGMHNVYNVIAGYVLIKTLNLDIDINKKLKTYKLPKRRMTEYKYKNNIIIDDYAHHPNEIKALLNAVKQKYKEDIIVVFQPHTYSRTITLKDSFLKVFDDVELFLCKTYSSVRENNNLEKDKDINKIFPKAKEYNNSTLEYLRNIENKVIIFLGAGVVNDDINKLIKEK